MRISDWSSDVCSSDLLASLIVPIAVLANMVGITLLVLLTYYFGDAVAQGFLHSTAGFLLFALALALIFAADALLGRLFQLREVGLGVDRKSVVWGKRVSDRVNTGGGGLIKKKTR